MVSYVIGAFYIAKSTVRCLWNSGLCFIIYSESFELMRKEQQKALKEKHKQTPDNHKENLGDVDLIALLETSEEHKSKQNENMLEVSAPPSNSQIDSSRSSLIHVPPSRPLVPPGFASVMLEKTLSVEPSNTCTPEVINYSFSSTFSMLFNQCALVWHHLCIGMVLSTFILVDCHAIIDVYWKSKWITVLVCVGTRNLLQMNSWQS